MATEINGKFRTPIAYTLTNGLSAELFSSVVKKSLVKMFNCGATVLSVTFDGLPSNFSAAESLGANFDVTSPGIKTFMNHPSTNDRVYFIPDACHMFKLLRNALEAYRSFTDEDGNEIKWSYLQNLVEHQKSEGLRAGNRVTTRHTDFSRQKMKVRLAVQLFSSSVSVALKFCEKIKLPNFQGASATSKFVALVDQLFDSMNSHPGGNGFKAPLSRNNNESWRRLFKNATSYFLNLKASPPTRTKLNQASRTKYLFETKRGKCIVGLIVCMTSLEALMNDVISSKIQLKYLPTYKLSQDILELFFSGLRQRFGNNNNPNALQLEFALRRMLTVTINPNLSGNCLPQDNGITRVSPLRSLGITNVHNSNEEEEKLQLLQEMPTLSLFVTNIVTYIAGFVGRNLLEKLHCEHCLAALFHCHPELVKIRSNYILISDKNNGGLFIPSEDLVRACNETEKVIRVSRNTNVKSLKSAEVHKLSMHQILQADIFVDLRTLSEGDHNMLSSHVFDLIRMIVTLYTKIRLHHIAKEATLELSPTTSRNELTKLVTFRNQ